MSSQVLVRRPLFEAQTTGTWILPESAATLSPLVDGKLAGGPLEYTFYFVFGAGAGAGVAVLETAHDPAFGGTWATIGTFTWAAASKVHYIALTQCVSALRIRFTSDVTGGTASCYYIASSR